MARARAAGSGGVLAAVLTAALLVAGCDDEAPGGQAAGQAAEQAAGQTGAAAGPAEQAPVASAAIVTPKAAEAADSPPDFVEHLMQDAQAKADAATLSLQDDTRKRIEEAEQAAGEPPAALGEDEAGDRTAEEDGEEGDTDERGARQ